MLNGKIALLTGANGGIGKSTLELFVKKGAKVICLIRKPDKKFIKYIKKFNNKVIVIVSDITNENNLKSEIEKAFTKINKLDILINNAGMSHGSIIEMTSQKKLKEVFNTNFFSQIYLIQLVLKFLKKSKNASIINIGSISAKIADRGTLAYGSSKTAFMHATKIMANEFSNYNIRVNGICPNATKTKMLNKMDSKARDVFISRSFMKKPCDPKDIANLIFFLSSKNSELINGQVVYIDGGLEC
tara:strand:+ start:487 stop:1218 length:732 start_codon:yes stop_codon:yes gene_type:complete